MTVPPEAVTAAVDANNRFFAADEDLKHSWRDGADVAELARWMLEAAAPLIAAAERDRWARLVTQELLVMLVDQGAVSADWADDVMDLLRDQPQ